MLTPNDQAVLAELPDAERTAWDQAVAIYAAGPAERDLLFDAAFSAQGLRLADLPDSAPPEGADVGELADPLTGAAPVYRKRWWPRHAAANAEFITGLGRFNHLYGAAVRADLAEALEADWPPEPIAADIVAYANWAGAYTRLGPVRLTLGSLDEANTGSSGFEILAHETAHGMMGRVRAILTGLDTSAPAVRRDLWHEILFYTVGEVVALQVPGHVPYADRNGLWSRAWPGADRELLARHMGRRLRGEASLEACLGDLVADLARAPSAPA